MNLEKFNLEKFDTLSNSDMSNIFGGMSGGGKILLDEIHESGIDDNGHLYTYSKYKYRNFKSDSMTEAGSICFDWDGAEYWT